MPRIRWWYSAVGLAVSGLTLLVAASAFHLADAKPASAPLDQFSAERAKHLLGELLGDGSPHPIGTQANAGVRDRIVGALRSWGYDPEVQTRWAGTARIARVDNIVARLRGNGMHPAILVTAHYDSVGAGPGAADDGIGTAIVLESARILKSEKPANDVVFLISDGEENGFLGAAAFTREHPWGGEYKAVINVDLGDGAGPFWIADASAMSVGLARVLRTSVAHPMVAYLGVTPAGWLVTPNSDFAIYTDQGWRGFNLVTYRADRTYHTPLDNLDNIDLRTLQHGGETALALTRALAQNDFSSTESGKIAMVDLFGRCLLWWPISWNSAILATAAGLFATAVLRLARSSQLTARGIWRCGLAWIVSFLLAIALGVCVLVTGVQLQAAAVAAIWVSTALLSSACFLWLTQRAGPWDMWVVVTGAFLFLGIFLFVFSRPLGHPFFLPVFAAALTVLLSRHRFASPWTLLVSALVPVVFAIILFVYDLYPALYAPIGLPGGSGLVLLIVLPLLPLAQSISRRTILVFACVLATAAFVGGRRSIPPHCSLNYFQDSNSGRAQWLAGIADPKPSRLPLFEAADFAKARSRPTPWSDPVFAAPAPFSAFDPPELRVIGTATKGNHWTVVTHLQSKRHAPIAFIMFPPAVQVETFEAMGAVVRPGIAGSGWKWASIQTVPPEGLEVKFNFAQPGPIDVVVFDVSYGLPDSGRAVERDRSRFAVPYGPGDMSSVYRALRLSGP